MLFKLTKDGDGEQIQRKTLGANAGLTFLNWTDEQFKLLACLAGCDYCPKLRNIGLITAHKYVHTYKTVAKVCDAVRLSFFLLCEYYFRSVALLILPSLLPDGCC